MRFVQKFINSQPFKNYITELTTAISSSTLNSKKDSSISFSPSTPKNSQPISCQNTLLASASSKNRPQRTSDPNFLDLCAEADHLWRRKSNSITNIGYVDDLGRYMVFFILLIFLVLLFIQICILGIKVILMLHQTRNCLLETSLWGKSCLK